MNITKRVNIDRENRRGDESLFAKRCLTRADTLQLLTIRSNGLVKKSNLGTYYTLLCLTIKM